VYSPSYVDGLSLTLDWYKIEIDNAITTLAGETINQGCYVGENQALCDLINRLPGGDIEELQANTLNAAGFTVKGVDLNVVYRAGELPLVPGEWKFTWDTAFVDDYTVCAPSATSASSCIDYVGFNTGDNSLPAFKSQFDIDWTYGDWEVSWRIRFIGAQAESCTTSGFPYTIFGPPCSHVNGSVFYSSALSTSVFQTPSGAPGTATNHLGATTYHNVQVSYNISEWDTRLTFGIQNIGDKQPPFSSQANANSFDPTTYEVPGRFPYLRISKTF